MCEVTKQNFEEKYPDIINDLRSASFISVDCEFTGLFDEHRSLFDSPKVRFNKLQNDLQNVLIAQFGLSTFKYERESNKFTASSYTFYLMPSTIFANYKFVCQIGSIDFLSRQGFDFNKLFYSGINFINKSDEAKVLKMLESESLINVSLSDIQKYCSKVAEWSNGLAENGEMLLKINEDSIFAYLLHREVRKRFSNLWTYSEEPGVIRIKKLNESEKRNLSLVEENIALRKKLFDSILGFSRILKEIETLKKPIVGHNCLIDLIIIYKQFYNPSPVSYVEFKKAITDIFPNIYDTKSVSFELRELLLKEHTWNSNNLSDLYFYLKNGKGANLVILGPSVNHKNSEFVKKENFHEAGFDSYCTGFCFIKMAHLFCLWDTNKKLFQHATMPTSTSWLLAAVEPLKNKINLTRGQVNYIVLNNRDPKNVRPDLLFIQSKTKEPLNISKIKDSIAKYDSVDIQLLNKYSGLMATANLKQFKEILKHFKNHREIDVNKYNVLKHSLLGKAVVSGTIIASLFFIIKLLKSTALSQNFGFHAKKLIDFL